MSQQLEPQQSRTRHWLGFVATGGVAFATDAAVLELLTRLFGLHPLLARPAAIGVAMIVAWIGHRTFTFAVKIRPTTSEFLRFAATASATALVNYSSFAAFILVHPDIPAFTALLASTAIATIFSYISMKYAVFNRR